MLHEGLKKGSFLWEFGTGSVECYAHARAGSGSFYVLTDKVVSGFPRVFQVRWDAVDYMAVARNISPMNGADYRYHYLLPLEQVWRLRDDLLLARRGRSKLNWLSGGKISKILFDETTYNPAWMPRLLEADVYPSLPPADTD